MNRLTHNKFIIILSYLLEITLLSILLLTLSKKIPLFPWYEPLTTYILLDLLILIGVEFLLLIFFWWLLDRNALYIRLRNLALCHLFTLLVMSLLSILSIHFFNLGCYIVCVLILLFIYLTIKYLKSHLTKYSTSLN